jgi:hypothetical protein
MTRTDVHSPTNLVTEDYDYAGCYDSAYQSQPPGNFVGVHRPGQCDHCGAKLRYVAILHHKPTDGLIEVGETCLDNRFSQATADFHKMREAARRDREHKSWALNHVDEHNFLRKYHEAYEAGGKFSDFLDSLWKGLQKYGSLTPKQTAVLQNRIVKSKQWEAEQASRPVPIPAAEPKPASEKQLSFINSLMEERQMTPEGRQEARRQFDAGLTMSQASRWIERLKTLPIIDRTQYMKTFMPTQRADEAQGDTNTK